MWTKVSFRGHHHYSGSPRLTTLFPQTTHLSVAEEFLISQTESEDRSHLSSAVCVWLLKTKPAVELEVAKGDVGLGEIAGR